MDSEENAHKTPIVEAVEGETANPRREAIEQGLLTRDQRALAKVLVIDPLAKIPIEEARIVADSSKMLVYRMQIVSYLDRLVDTTKLFMNVLVAVAILLVTTA